MLLLVLTPVALQPTLCTPCSLEYGSPMSALGGPSQLEKHPGTPFPNSPRPAPQTPLLKVTVPGEPWLQDPVSAYR